MSAIRRLALLAALALGGCCCFPFGGDGSDDDDTAATQTDPNAPPPSSPAPVPAPTATPYDAAFVDAHLARLRSEAGCDATTRHPRLGLFCAAVSGWATGTTAPFPIGSAAKAGITTWIPTEGSVEEADARLRRFSVLATDSAGQLRGDITTPEPRHQLDTGPGVGMAQVEARLGGTPGPIAIPIGLYDYVNQRPTQAQYPLATTPTGWQIQGGSYADLRRVGDTWVAVEVPRNAPAGLYFSVFVDAPVRSAGF